MYRFFLVAVLALTPCLRAQESVRYTDLLDAMVDLDWLWRPAPAGERCVQFSSYDRRSEKGATSYEDWYANGDAGQFLRVEERDGRKERVMVDVAGPGAVVRIWSANPKGTLRFYLDGAKIATWTIPFDDLCGGKKAPFLEPLAGVRSRGWNCHLPVPFARHLVVTCDEDRFYYQVNVRLFPAGTAVESFVPSMLTEHGEAIECVRAKLQAGALVFGQVGALIFGERHECAGELAAGGSALLFASEGGRLVKELRLQVAARESTPLPRGDLLRCLRLEIRCAGETLVDVPAADFFGSAPEWRPYATYVMGVDADGWAWCRLPMPLPGAAEIRLHADRAGVDYVARWKAAVTHEELPTGDVLCLHASWHQQRRIRTRPFSDHLVLAAEGRGRFVGCSLHVTNPVKAWWGEGDEKLWVDGESFPSTFGTGTEDYFGYAWCCPQTFTSAYHAQPHCDGPGNFGHTCVDRFQIPDSVPFQRSFRFDLEVWHGSGKLHEVDYASVAYWYAAPAAIDGLPGVARARERLPRVVEVPAAFRVEGALEGERLRCTASGGKTEVQDCSGFEHGPWSGDAHLWWTGARPGDVLTLEVPVAEAGRYRLHARFTKARDYGVIDVAWDGKRVGDRLDLYDPAVVPTTELDLGEHRLDRGTHRLTLTIAGHNPQAIAAHMVGIDYVRLLPLDG